MTEKIITEKTIKTDKIIREIVLDNHQKVQILDNSRKISVLKEDYERDPRP